MSIYAYTNICIRVYICKFQGLFPHFLRPLTVWVALSSWPYSQRMCMLAWLWAWSQERESSPKLKVYKNIMKFNNTIWQPTNINKTQLYMLV